LHLFIRPLISFACEWPLYFEPGGQPDDFLSPGKRFNTGCDHLVTVFYQITPVMQVSFAGNPCLPLQPVFS